ASITDGFDVFVQLVIAAITTLPCCSAWPFVETCSWTFGSSTPTAVGLPPSCSQRLTLNEASAGTATAALAFGLISEGNALANDSPAFDSTTRSCGRFGRAGVVKESLLARVGFDQRDLLLTATSEFQVANALFVDGEYAAGGAVFRSHVSNRRAIGERQILQAGAEVLDELADHTVLAQHLGDGKNKVGSGRAFAQASGQLHADHERDQHGDGLSKHGGLGFDTAHAPAQHAESVDHGGMRVGADKCVGIG